MPAAFRDGYYIGAARAQELRDSMLISLAGYLGLAVLLKAPFGKHGFWCAMLAFTALRAFTLALRLPAVERNRLLSRKTLSRHNSRGKV